VRYLDLVSCGMAHGRDKVALVADDGVRLTFGELDRRAAQLGGALRNAGLSPGDRVAVLSLNELEVTEIQVACMRSGFAAVPLNARLTAPELAFILGDVEPSLLIVGRTLADAAGAAMAAAGMSVPVVSLGGSYDEFLAAGEVDADADPTDPSLPAAILYTSGTTGRPKGAVVDRLALSSRIAQGAIDLRVRPDDVWLQSLPMFHIASVCTYATLARGGTSVQLSTFGVDEFLRLLVEERCTATGLVPTLIEMVLLDERTATIDHERLRLIVYGGAPISPGLLRRAMETFGCEFAQMYGQTEAGIVTMLQPELHRIADGDALASAGVAAFSWEIDVVGPNDESLAAGAVGEIVGRGPGVMSHYWNRPDATADSLRRGWIHTGDLGLLDERGLVRIVDRRNDMIITGGENVYPREIERVLLEREGVDDAAVIGSPDERWGERVVAFVVADVDDEELDRWAREQLASYKVPRMWVHMAELPRNVTGKVTKPALRRMIHPSERPA
jgi:acyl-CoA synthetase (AMP-forming)/AMP-acid ligase II